MNARFWTFLNGGWVKLTLRPGQSLSWVHFSHHDEGWTREGETWTIEAGAVVNEWWEEGTDCDGRLDRAGTRYCHLSALRGRDMMERNPCDENQGIYSPEWQTAHAFQRDYSAEAMGY